MSFAYLFLLAVGLSMDAFAVAVCKGLALKTLKWPQALTVGLWFGGFQALMPALGYLAGSRFYTYIERFDHWIAFILLALIGANMLREAFSDEEEKVDAGYRPREMFILAIATSIDALAVGVSLAMLQVRIVPAVLLIGATTFVISFAGVRIGNVFGSRYRKPSVIAGGVILILIGIKILIEHLTAG